MASLLLRSAFTSVTETSLASLVRFGHSGVKKRFRFSSDGQTLKYKPSGKRHYMRHHNRNRNRLKSHVVHITSQNDGGARLKRMSLMSKT